MVTVCPSQFATRRTLFHVLVGCGLLMLKVSRLDRKSGSAGMPRPISYAVFCLKKKTGPRTRACASVLRGGSRSARLPPAHGGEDPHAYRGEAAGVRPTAEGSTGDARTVPPAA